MVMTLHQFVVDTKRVCRGGKSFYEMTLKQFVLDVAIKMLHKGDDSETVCRGGDYSGFMWR